MLLLRNFLTILVLCGLAACGFKPVYKNYGADGDLGLSPKLAAIDVSQLHDSRQAQEITVLLSDLLDPHGLGEAKLYTLDLNIETRKDGSVIQRNRQITRYSIIGTVNYTLKDKSSGKLMKKGQSVMSGSYDAIASEFSNFTAEQDTTSKIMQEIARDIRFQLTTYFLDSSKKDTHEAPAKGH